MNKTELVQRLSESKNITKVEAENVITLIFSTIVDELKQGNTVKIPGFGNFTIKVRKQRFAIIPTSTVKVIIPEYKTVAFKPAKSFKDLVKHI